MKPWITLYKAQHDWRGSARMMMELRFGLTIGDGGGFQGGILWPLGISLWRNSDYEPLVQWRWAPARVAATQ